ncbi:MAG: ABC transporter permease [Acidimicrobiales bacterium]
MAHVEAVALERREPRFMRPRWLGAFMYFAYSYKRTWRGSITTSFLYPVLYLAAMGVGLGSLVDHHVGRVGGVSYLHFLAPGLLAATAMQVGGSESMYPIMGAIKWNKTYYAMLATPLSYKDVLRGHLVAIACRLFSVCAIYTAILAAFGTTSSDLAVLVIPAGVLTGLAFVLPIVAYSALQTNQMGFTAIYRMGLIPLFLFSGTFFPVTQLPGWLQVIAYATPLYHGVALCRGLVIGGMSATAALAHIGYLVALALIGYGFALRSYRKRLLV